jgi:hypothetical protein
MMMDGILECIFYGMDYEYGDTLIFSFCDVIEIKHK